MIEPEPGSEPWLIQVSEDIVDPARPIIDPHHHLWKKRFGRDYLLEDLWRDTGSGHRIEQTVFMECSAFYYREGPTHLRPLGETAYITECARLSRQDRDRATVTAIVAHADLRLAAASEVLLRELLDRHLAVSAGLVRGIRHCAAWDADSAAFTIPGWMPPGLYGDAGFRHGLQVLAEYGLSFDAWHYHHQQDDFIELVQHVPECTFVLDHFGTPLGVGRHRHRRQEIFGDWQQSLTRLARCDNVYIKLGGLAMPDNGFDWHLASRPPTSDEFVKAQRQYYLHAIDCFGPGRCMFESNFPVDRLSISYRVLWNGFKKMVQNLSEAEQHALFYGTAEKVYRLGRKDTVS